MVDHWMIDGPRTGDGRERFGQIDVLVPTAIADYAEPAGKQLSSLDAWRELGENTDFDE